MCKSFQSCPTLCDPMDCSPLGSSVHGILQARILRDLPDPGVGPRSPVLQVDSLPSEPVYILHFILIKFCEVYTDIILF